MSPRLTNQGFNFVPIRETKQMRLNLLVIDLSHPFIFKLVSELAFCILESILLVTGDLNNGTLTFAVDLYGKPLNCSPPALPVPRKEHSMGKLKGTPFLCGGSYISDQGASVAR